MSDEARPLARAIVRYLHEQPPSNWPLLRLFERARQDNVTPGELIDAIRHVRVAEQRERGRPSRRAGATSL